jgi:hypothetical protein
MFLGGGDTSGSSDVGDARTSKANARHFDAAELKRLFRLAPAETVCETFELVSRQDGQAWAPYAGEQSIRDAPLREAIRVTGAAVSFVHQDVQQAPAAPLLEPSLETGGSRAPDFEGNTGQGDNNGDPGTIKRARLDVKGDE